MSGEAILVIDAGQDVDQRMAAALEAEGYLVYPVSIQDVNAEMAELLRPSLIYIKPPELSPTGLDPCKVIHAIPLLKKVPIILLASPTGAPGPDDFKDYGIVDCLEPTFGPEELIEKTGTILGKTLPSRSPRGDKPVASRRTTRKMEKKRSPLFLPAVSIAILLMIAGAGFLAYRQFMPARKALPSPAVTGFLRAPSTVPKAGIKTQLPPAKKDAGPPAPASAVSPSPPGAGSKTQLPSGRNVAETPAPVSAAPSTPSPGKPSSLPSEASSQLPRKPFHSVQLGAFKNGDTAKDLTKKFREKGYDAFTRPGVMKDGSPVYRVLVGRYEERKAAQKLAGEIQLREDVKTALYGE